MDYVLVREILEFVEKNRRSDGRHISLCLDSYADDQTQYHARLCAEAGLFMKLSGPTIVYPIELTLAGHRKLRELRERGPEGSQL